MITTNQKWLKASLVIYFLLIIGLIVAVMLNFLYIDSAPQINCPNVNDCVECPTIPCDELVVTTCPTADLSMSQLTEPNPSFEFYLVGAVASTPLTTGDIGVFDTVFGSSSNKASDLLRYFPTVSFSSGNAVKWTYSTQYLNFLQPAGQMNVSTVAITGTLHALVMSSSAQISTASGVITYANGNVVLTVAGPITYYLYLADADTELPLLLLPSGNYPVWTTTTPPPALTTVTYPKYVWSLYQV